MADLPEPPYPASIQAKGWHFELNPTRIAQSDTWDLANEIPMCRPALLMMWFVAWQQSPCGSLPADEQVIRAKLQVSPDLWPAMRELLLRGWWKAADGRLYHNTLTELVKEMMAKRRSDADRQALNRSKKSGGSDKTHAEVTRDKGVTPEEVQCESSTDHLPLNTSSPSSKRKARERAPAVPTVAPDVLIAAGFDGDTAAEFIAHKDRAKAPLTERAWKDHCREADRAGWSPMQAAEKVMAKGWKGFEAKYVAGEPRPGARPPPVATESPITRSKREAYAQWGGGRVAAKAPAAQGEILEMTDGHR